MRDPRILWLLGPTSSGKTTVAVEVVAELREKGIAAIHYDGDEVRDIFGQEHGFDAEDRLKVVKTLVYLANKSIDAGLTVIISALTANPDAREYVRNNANNLLMGYVSCPIEICIERDPKGLYARAKKGEIDTLIGYNSEYIPPENPDLIINTDTKTLGDITRETVQYLSSWT